MSLQTEQQPIGRQCSAVRTSAEGRGEVPLGAAPVGHDAGQDAVALQHKARLTAVADLVPHVVAGAVDHPVGDDPRGAARMAGQHCNREENTGDQPRQNTGQTPRCAGTTPWSAKTGCHQVKPFFSLPRSSSVIRDQRIQRILR